MTDLEIATLAAALILVASIFSVELAISSAIIEIAFGVLAGNFAHLTTTPWIDFIASFAGVLLTFLAGAEVDPRVLRERPKQAAAIGGLSFLAPFVAVGLFAYFAAGWNVKQSEIAGIALSTTSLAVVYAVLVETGLTKTALGKLIMAATFITDLGTVTALSVLFITPTPYLALFAIVSIGVIATMVLLERPFFRRYGDRVIEPEIKGAFLALFLLMWTVLTFGTISSLYGLNSGIIDRSQFSILITAVILSAVLPTVVAQRFFSPPLHKLTTEEEINVEDEEFAPAPTHGGADTDLR